MRTRTLNLAATRCVFAATIGLEVPLAAAFQSSAFPSAVFVVDAVPSPWIQERRPLPLGHRGRRTPFSP
jgi:hypothetical protein